MKYGKYLLILMLLTLNLRASEKEEYVLVIDNYGIYLGDRYEPIKSLSPFDNSTNGILTTTDPLFVCETRQVPMKIGTSFGIRFKLIGPEGMLKIDDIEAETHHPLMLDAEDEYTTVSRWRSTISHYETGGYVGGIQFVFEEDHELIEGTWSLVGKAFGQRIEKSFEVGDFKMPDASGCHSL